MTATKLDLNGLLKDIGDQIKTLAVAEFADFKTAAVKDGTAFSRALKNDIAVWSAQVAVGDLTQDDLQFLIEGKMAVAQLRALKQAGLAKVRVQKFRTAVIGILADSVVNAAKKIV